MRFIVLGIVLMCAAAPVYADVSFVSNPIWISSETVTEGQPVRVSTAVMKSGDGIVSGTVMFFAEGATIGTSDFSMQGSTMGTVASVSWTPVPGSYRISARITRVTVSENGETKKDIETSTAIEARETLTVQSDTDRDGVPDDEDTNDDNDGVSDADELATGTNPLWPDAADGAQVAGASTTATEALSRATEQAASMATTLFEKAEMLRERGAAYFDTQLANMRTETATTSNALPAEGIVIAEPVSFMDQVREAPSFLPTVLSFFYTALSFVFNNIYAFYLSGIALVLWILRKIWKRHSLD